MSPTSFPRCCARRTTHATSAAKSHKHRATGCAGPLVLHPVSGWRSDTPFAKTGGELHFKHGAYLEPGA